jgi:undecaprenyl diphosphate synthase
VHLLEAIEDYQRRERRYGGLADGGESEENAEQPANALAP